MLAKQCKRCGRVYTGDTCTCTINDVSHKEHDRERHKKYDTTKRNEDSRKFYSSWKWKKLTKVCKDRCSGIDQYQLIKHKRLVVGTLSHHIIEITEDASKAYDIDNLIWISEQSHREIHSIYARSDTAKRELQKFLKKIIESV